MNEHLRHLIKEKSFRKGQFTLASGQSTNYFFDLKPTMLDPEGSFLIGHAILNKLVELDVTPDAIGGMATGGIPLVSTICTLSFIRGTPIPVFFVRKEAKDHGTERRIEGSVLVPGQTVVLVEDVTTTGGSIMQAVQAVRAAQCHVYRVITVIDRLEGAAENLAIEGITLNPIFLRSDFD